MAALLLLAAGGLYLWLGREAPPPPPTPPPPSYAELENGYLEKARNAVDGEEALAVLREGLAELPYSSRLPRRYLDRALVEAPPRDILEIYVEERMATAERLLAEQDYEATYEVLERVLFIVPEHPQARGLSDSIESRRQRQRRERQARQAAAPPPPPAPVAAPPPPPPPPPARGELRIDFRTVIAEGKVRVTASGQTLLERSFNFPNRRLFKRKYLSDEQGFAESQTLDAGAVSVAVTVEVDTKNGMQTLSRDLRGNLPADGRRVLRITVTEAGELEVRFE